MNRTTAVLSVGIAALAGAASAQPQACEPRLVGMDRRGPAHSIARAGDRLYLGAGATLQVVDVGDPLAPVTRGWVNLGRLATDVAAWGAVAVVRDTTGLDFVDVSNPEQPEVVGTLDFAGGGEVPTVTAMDSHAYFVAADGLHVVDFSDPTQPVEVGAFPVTEPVDVALRGNRAYLLASDSIRVLDVSNPSAPSEIASVDDSINSERIVIATSGNRLATWGTWGCGHRICSHVTFFGLGNPDLPVLRSSFGGEDSSVAEVAFGVERAFVHDGWGSFQILDLSDLANPVFAGEAPADEPVQMFAASSSDFLFVADRAEGLRVYDVADPATAHEVANVAQTSNTSDGYLLGSLAVTTHERGLRIFDLADPARPAVVGGVDGVSVGAKEILRVGTHAYADGPNSVHVFDLTDPLDPEPLGSFGTYVVNPPVLDRETLFLLEGCNERVALLDVSDPGNPIEVNSIPIDDGCYKADIAAGGGRLYVWDLETAEPMRLRIFEVSDPSSLLELSSTDLGSHWARSAVRGRMLLLADEERFSVVDASDPTHPAVVAVVPLPAANWFQRRISLYGSQALVAPAVAYYEEGLDDRVHLIDAIDPYRPRLAASLETPGDGRGAFAGPGLVVVADGPAGISVYESCVPFADGFESGDASAWSASQP